MPEDLKTKWSRNAAAVLLRVGGTPTDQDQVDGKTVYHFVVTSTAMAGAQVEQVNDGTAGEVELVLSAEPVDLGNYAVATDVSAMTIVGLARDIEYALRRDGPCKVTVYLKTVSRD